MLFLIIYEFSITTFEEILGVNYLLAITGHWKYLHVSLDVLIDVWPQIIYC